MMTALMINATAEVMMPRLLSFAVKAKLFPPPASQTDRTIRWSNKGTQAIHITTVNGSVEIRRRLYWANQYGCCAPLDSWLGLSSRYSQGVREMVCRIGLDGSYRKSADDLRRLSQITLSYQSLRKVFQAEGQKLLIAQRTGDLAPTFNAEQCRVAADKPTCLITGADGFQVPLITDEEARKRRVRATQRRAKLRRKGHTLGPLPKRSRGSDQRWKEAKLVTFYDPSGRYQHTAATTGNHKVLGRIMRREATKLRLDKADRKYSVSDGAQWIRRQYSQQLPMLEAMVLDYYHLRDHAVICSKSLYGEGTAESQRWRKDFCQTMLQSGPFEALTELAVLIKRHRGHKRQALQSLHGYIARRTEMLDYPRYLAEGFQIGSGPTESQCKCLTDRLKGRGRRWNGNAIDAHLAVNCLHSNSGQWSTYWPKVSVP
jgi:hypothetical protein